MGPHFLSPRDTEFEDQKRCLQREQTRSQMFIQMVWDAESLRPRGEVPALAGVHIGITP